MSSLQEHPYRLFFPLGGVCGSVGTGYWLCYVLGWLPTFSGQAHAFVQIQAFLMAFACGFLFTMLPRRTQSASPTPGELWGTALALSVTMMAALVHAWIWSEVAFLFVLLVMTRFAAVRLGGSRAGRRPPNSFVLIPLGFLCGALGAVLVIAQSVSLVPPQANFVARGLIQEGMFLCLLFGVGHMLLPLLGGYPLPPDGDDSAAHRRERAVFLSAGLVLILSYPLQLFVQARVGYVEGVWLAYVIRALVATYLLFVRAKAYRFPRGGGSARKTVWMSCWCVVVGLWLVVLFPAYRVAFLHVLFIGGLGLMALAVGCHVILGHSGFPELRDGRARPVMVFSHLILFAMATRVSADFLPNTYWLHLGAASGIWLAGAAVWFWFLLPKLRDSMQSSVGDAPRDVPLSESVTST